MISWVLLIGFIGQIYSKWFTCGLISAGDLSYFYRDWLVSYFNLPFYWESFRNLGLGGRSFLNLGVYYYNLPLGYFSRYFDYPISERLVWFFPLLFLGILSPLILVSVLSLFPRRNYPLSIFLFIINTYFLMITSGGQITVVLGYLTLPLVFAFFIKYLEINKLYFLIPFCLFFSFTLIWDFRLFYILCVVLILYILWEILAGNQQRRIKVIFISFRVLLLAGFVALGLNIFWVVPFFMFFGNSLPDLSSAYTTEKAVKYFSTADFAHSFALLHPNWPENLFGKTYFLQPEFLAIPLLAFSALYFIQRTEKFNRENRLIIFFALIGLLGAFLSKGANLPFGGVYLWMFSHMPGFIMFRDPTKWYILTVLSYLVLIPFTVSKLSLKFSNLKVKSVLPLIVLMTLAFLIRPAVLGNIKGTLKTINVPKEYFLLKDIFSADKKFYRTLWLPSFQRFGYFSDNHPAISGSDYFDTNDQNLIISKLKTKGTEEELRIMGVKYIIVPVDALGEIFLTDRKYDAQKKEIFLREIRSISYLIKEKKIGGLSIFEINSPNDRFVLSNKKGKIEYFMVNPALYRIKITTNSKDKLVFSEYFDPLWTFTSEKHHIISRKTENNLNSFELPAKGFYNGIIEFAPQKYSAVLTLVTILFLSSVIIFLLYAIYKKI